MRMDTPYDFYAGINPIALNSAAKDHIIAGSPGRAEVGLSLIPHHARDCRGRGISNGNRVAMVMP
jgi:hypothetical protein